MKAATEINDWFDFIRHPMFVDLARMNYKSRIVYEIKGGSGDFVIDYDGLYPIKEYPTSIKNPPDFMAVGNPTRNSSKGFGGPVHQADQLLYVWGEFTDGKLRPHREDGFPSIIEVSNLTKHYLNGIGIGRKEDGRPALKADYIFAHWHQGGKRHRPNGPLVVQLRNHREYWTGGKMYFFREASIKLHWGDDLLENPQFERFLRNLRGTVNPKANRYFSDKKDEFQFMTDFAIRDMNMIEGSLTHQRARVLGVGS